MQHREFLKNAKRKRDKGKNSSTSRHYTGSESTPNKNDGTTSSAFTAPIKPEILERDPLLLNIGAMRRESDWIAVNSQASSQFGYSNEIDVVRKMHNLFGFPNGSVSALYSSHTLEHGSFGDGELDDVLMEWKRVLRPGGLLLVSVPDLPTLATMYVDPALSFSQHWMVTRMIYGAQVDADDYHKIGFDETLLAYYLQKHGFCDLQRVENFNLPFQDTSSMIYAGYTISLNMVAYSCEIKGQNNGPQISHRATPYTGPSRLHRTEEKQ